MGCIVIDDEVDVQLFGYVAINVAQKLKQLLMTMSSLASGKDRLRAMSRAANKVMVPCHL